MTKPAPVGIILVSDYARMNTYLAQDDACTWFVSATDPGFISQNIYLYCAAANLSTAVLALVDRDGLGSVLGLSPHETVVYTQVVGNARGRGCEGYRCTWATMHDKGLSDLLL